MGSVREPNASETLHLRSLRRGDCFHAYPEYKVERDQSRCIRCLVCVRQCPYEATFYDPSLGLVYNRHENCVNCKRCGALCPTDCIEIRRWGDGFRKNDNWRPKVIRAIYKQADTGGVLLTGLGNDLPYRNYFDHLVLERPTHRGRLLCHGHARRHHLHPWGGRSESAGARGQTVARFRSPALGPLILHRPCPLLPLRREKRPEVPCYVACQIFCLTNAQEPV